MPHLEFGPLTTLFAQIAAIIVVSRLLGVVLRKIGQPHVMAEVLAGILLGPSLFGWLWPDAMATLFPASSLGLLTILSQVGLVLFMFLVGLELDPKLLHGRARASVVISHTSIVFPFALGVGTAWWLYESYSPATVEFTPFALFLGVSMSVTAFPVLARILSERNLTTSQVGAITIACAAVDDVTAWCLLACVVGVTRAGALTEGLWTTGLALAFIVVMLHAVRPFLRRVATRVDNPDALTPNVMAILLLLLFASSFATEVIGIHALFGAFLFGAILPKDGHLSEVVVEKIETVAVVLLLPLFFAFSGLRTEIGLLDDGHDVLVALLLIVVASVGKFGGSTIAARLTGLPWREASAIGILMNTRGLMELIVLNIGLDLGVISPTVFTMLVIMALATTFATTPILRWVYPDSALSRMHRVGTTGLEPSRHAPFSLLMCVGDEAAGTAMATLASRLVGPGDEGGSVYALHLATPTHRPSVERRKRETNEHAPALIATTYRARELGLAIRPLEFVSTDPGADICRTAEAKQVSMILLGSHKPLLLQSRMGGAVRKVLDNTDASVGILVDRGLQKVERVLVAYAGGAEDLAALRVAQRLGRNPSVKITLLHVVDPAEPRRSRRGRTQIDEVFSEPGVAADAVRVQIVEHSSPPDAVLEEAATGYDLVVVGVNARWGLGTGLPVTRRERVLAEATVSVLAVRPRTAPVAAPGGAEAEAEPSPGDRSTGASTAR